MPLLQGQARLWISMEKATPKAPQLMGLEELHTPRALSLEQPHMEFSYN